MMIYGLGMLTMILGIYIGHFLEDSRLSYNAYIVYGHSAVLLYHARNLREFWTEPDQNEVKKISDKKIADRKERLKREKS